MNIRTAARIFVAAIGVVFSLSANASTWQFTYSGIAFSSDGYKGTINVRYTWDTDAVTYDIFQFFNPITHCDPRPGYADWEFRCHSFDAWADAPAVVDWWGLASGHAETHLYAFTIPGDIWTQFGGTYSPHVGLTPAMLAKPLSEIESDWSPRLGGEWDVGGGEGNWRWQRDSFGSGLTTVADRTIHLSLLRAPEPATLALVVLGMGLVAVRRKG